MTQPFNVPRGTADILPSSVHLWQSIESNSRRILEAHGYREIRTPIFENTMLFARSVGQTSDIVSKQMLNLVAQRVSESDPIELSGLSLRPEGTASVARAYIEAGLDRKEPLSKLYYIGPMFRGERPQKGRLRQFHQIGVEAMGPDSASPYLDAEVIALSIGILQIVGLKEFQLQINTLGSVEDKKTVSEWLRKNLKNSLSKLPEAERERFDRNIFRLLDSKNSEYRDIVKSLDMSQAPLSVESRNYFSEVRLALDGLGIEYTVNPNLVRGLDYYTHTVFEITSSSLGSQDALGAGGRYNNLVKELGGPAVDAVGFALGIERMILALGPQAAAAKLGADVYIVTFQAEYMGRAFKYLNTLRYLFAKSRENIICDMCYRKLSPKTLMKWADKIKARNVLILGDEEIKGRFVTLRDMKTGQQEKISLTGNKYGDDDITPLVNILKERCSEV